MKSLKRAIVGLSVRLDKTFTLKMVPWRYLTNEEKASITSDGIICFAGMLACGLTVYNTGLLRDWEFGRGWIVLLWIPILTVMVLFIVMWTSQANKVYDKARERLAESKGDSL